jgi:hypothetical protein
MTVDNRETDGGISPSDIPSMPTKCISTWDGPAEWLKQATIAQNQIYRENAGRMYDLGENYDCIELKILKHAFGNIRKFFD